MGMKTYPSQNQQGASDEDDCPHSHKDWPISNPDPLHRGHLDLTPSPFPKKSVRFVTSARAASNCTRVTKLFIISRCALSCYRQAQDINGVHHAVTFQYLTAEWVSTDVLHDKVDDRRGFLMLAPQSSLTKEVHNQTTGRHCNDLKSKESKSIRTIFFFFFIYLLSLCSWW